MEGLLAAAAGGGAVGPATDAQLEVVRQAARARARTDLMLERVLRQAAGVLDAAGVTHRALKGSVWAHTSYPDPSWRGSGDVDLLVAEDDWYRAVEAMEAAGARRSLPEIRAGFDRRFGKEATLVTEAGWEVDLHRTFVVGPFGLWVDRGELLERSVTVDLGGRRLAVLDPEAAFLHACFNAALADDPPRLIAVRDVAQMAALDLDAGAVAGMARRWHAGGVVVRALRLVQERLGVDLGGTAVAAACAGHRTSPLERALLASYRGPARGYTSQLAAAVAMPGISERFAYLRAIARPSPEYLAARQWSATSAARVAGRRMLERPRRMLGCR
jgi:hypothetical protein